MSGGLINTKRCLGIIHLNLDKHMSLMVKAISGHLPNYRTTCVPNKYVVYRKRKVYVGEGKISDLDAVFKKFHQETFLFPTSNILKSDVPNFLDKLNLKWKRAILYRTVVSDLSDLRDVYYDILTFFSPSGIESLFKNFPDFKQNETRIAAYGNSTIQAAEEAGLEVHIKAPTEESPSMTMAIGKYVEKANKA